MSDETGTYAAGAGTGFRKLLVRLANYFIAIMLTALVIWLLLGWLAPIYLPFVPAAYLAAGYWHTVGMVYLTRTIAGLFRPLKKDAA